MTQITNHRRQNNYTMFDLVREGELVATVMKMDRPFAPWNVHTDAGRQQFANKSDALNYCSML